MLFCKRRGTCTCKSGCTVSVATIIHKCKVMNSFGLFYQHKQQKCFNWGVPKKWMQIPPMFHRNISSKYVNDICRCWNTSVQCPFFLLFHIQYMHTVLHSNQELILSNSKQKRQAQNACLIHCYFLDLLPWRRAAAVNNP